MADTLEWVLSQPDHAAAIATLPRPEVEQMARQFVTIMQSQRRRALVRQKESAARGIPIARQVVEAGTRDAVGAAIGSARAAYKAVMLRKYGDLMGESIDLGDGRSTTWGHATVKDHLTRIAMLDRQAAGISESIRLHQDAIDGMNELGIISLEWLC